MDFVPRTLQMVCNRDLEAFPVLTLTGPRQSGKSTLVKKLLPDWRYVNLEQVEYREFAESDPKGFLQTYSDRVVFDEIQRTPSLLSSIQVLVDEDRTPGRFVLTGSHNLLLLEQISQSLAGRTSIRNLLPFSFEELSGEPFCPLEIESALFRGGYPLVYEEKANCVEWLKAYIQTYVERDVRLIRNVSSLSTFERFVRVCAGRTGQLLDFSSVGNDLGITHNTVREWIGVLEVGFICFRLEPYYKNYSKRLIKSSKLYFYDTGLLAVLLNINSADELLTHPFRGAVFENWCVAECLKAFVHSGMRPNAYFWRDKKIEVDLLIESQRSDIFALECKSGRTAHSDFLSAPLALQSIVNDRQIIPAVIYGGDTSQERSQGKYFSWKDFGKEISTLIGSSKHQPVER